MELSYYDKIDLREQWKDEAKDFTPWLAEDINIGKLGEAIGLDLEVIGREEKVGSFSADILCRDITTGKLVVIENQLEQTDHSHLGQVITYCAGLQASIFIWIASQIREEHRAAVDWLNTITDDNFNFFAIEMQLFRIDENRATPHFLISAKPNNWSKNVISQAKNELNETDKLRVEYWEAYKEYVLAQPKLSFNPQKPLPQNWSNVAIGTSAAHISVVIGRHKTKIAVQLYLDSDNAKDNYDKLYKSSYEKSLIELGSDIKWNRLEERKISLIEATIEGDYHNKKDWQRQFKWFYETTVNFRSFFMPLVKSMK